MNYAVTCREYAFGSDTYREAVLLREAVLRKPLGRQWVPGDFTEEEMSFHLGAFMGERLVGTLILRPIDACAVQMRQVAVAPQEQSHGVGTALVGFAEAFAAAHGYATIIAHARESALGFYLKLGYLVTSERYMEIGIPHFEVGKELVVTGITRPQ